MQGWWDFLITRFKPQRLKGVVEKWFKHWKLAFKMKSGCCTRVPTPTSPFSYRALKWVCWTLFHNTQSFHSWASGRKSWCLSFPCIVDIWTKYLTWRWVKQVLAQRAKWAYFSNFLSKNLSVRIQCICIHLVYTFERYLDLRWKCLYSALCDPYKKKNVRWWAYRKYGGHWVFHAKKKKLETREYQLKMGDTLLMIVTKMLLWVNTYFDKAMICDILVMASILNSHSHFGWGFFETSFREYSKKHKHGLALVKFEYKKRKAQIAANTIMIFTFDAWIWRVLGCNSSDLVSKTSVWGSFQCQKMPLIHILNLKSKPFYARTPRIRRSNKNMMAGQGTKVITCSWTVIIKDRGKPFRSWRPTPGLFASRPAVLQK